MPFIIADRVRETSTTVGTGSIALDGAVTGYQSFDAVLDTADTTYYTIADQGGANWEVGIGTFTSPSTLARTTILSSSNGGSIVNFGAGTKDVFISLPASRTVQSVSAGTTGLTPSTDSFGAVTLGGTLAVTNGGTGATTAPNALTNLGAVAKAGDTMTGVLGVVAGTVSAPGLAFSGDTNTGIYSPAADTVAIVEGGVEALRINSNAQAEFTAGTAGLPSVTTTGDTNTGIFFPDADTVAISTNGAEDFRIGPAGQIGLQGANYGTSGQVLTSNGPSAAPSWQSPAGGGVTSFNTRTGAVTLSSGDVTTALGYTPVNRAGDTMTGNLTIQNTAPTLTMADTNNITRSVHTNDALIGFLGSGGGWTMYNNNSGQIWSSNYGWLHDFFFNNIANCANCGGMQGWGPGNCPNFSSNYLSAINCFVSGGQLNDGGATISRSDYYDSFKFNCNCACNC